ncbi:MAG: DegV family protein [Ruminococcaceae bacterium]|nr:DegV family protein [Oscillospiraceae bacterium]
MKNFVIIPDVTCDLSEEIRDYFKLERYVNGYVHINDESFPTQLDWSVFSRESFYKTLANAKNKVSSAAASPEEYYLIFKEYAEQGMDILSMSISSKISGTYSIAASAAERIREEYPACNIYCLDSLRMSGAFGVLVAYACEMKNNGSSFDEVVAWLEQNKNRVHQMGPIDDLTFVARRGQISSGKAIMGNLVGIKPMGDCNADGYVTVLVKMKGIKKALEATVTYLGLAAKDLSEQYVFIMHTDREKYASLLKEKIEERYPCKKVFVSDVFGGCGTNIGPGMIGVYFMGDPVSEGCVKEKELLTLAISQSES